MGQSLGADTADRPPHWVVNGIVTAFSEIVQKKKPSGDSASAGCWRLLCAGKRVKEMSPSPSRGGYGEKLIVSFYIGTLPPRARGTMATAEPRLANAASAQADGRISRPEPLARRAFGPPWRRSVPAITPVCITGKVAVRRQSSTVGGGLRQDLACLAACYRSDSG